MELTQRIVAELERRLIANNFGEITLEMKCNGDRVTIVPCSYVDIKKMQDIEYFLVYSRLPWGGNDKIEKVADFLVHYQERIEDTEDEKKQLRAYYNKYHNTPQMDWTWYSDWYKDVYGYRPR